MGMISLLRWNVRGLNGPNKQNEVKLLCNKQQLGLISLLKTKIKKNSRDKIVESIFGGWNHIHNLDTHYNGRIMVVWRPDYIPHKLSFIVSFVYAFNTREERNELWSMLQAIHRSHRKPWLVLGEFNVVLHVEDKISGNSISLTEVVDFATCIDNCGLIEHPHQGNQYTWSDKGGISDHCPIKVNIIEERKRKKSFFLYCNARGKILEFKRLVTEGWGVSIHECKMMQVVKKLKQLKKSLRRLNSQQFSNIHISYLVELYLQQQSKVTWLKLGDDYTRYFFLVIKPMRLKLATTQLRDENGQWRTDL
ncbi:hypothetical protein R3W88_026531 [Solanum pinnatisectum]|uniref:Reverse transcriptase n=1 Tax=Solanum pinnatisectum TaxID=50273 RepID=A0AAV9LEM6_9SOLN|nr:hypothetical protein R3W88_026531 [Solanum pinnatisectum]